MVEKSHNSSSFHRRRYDREGNFWMTVIFYLRKSLGQVPVAHICHSSYSEGRDEEDCSLKLAWQIVQETLS
jgi:hypothetical protein